MVPEFWTACLNGNGDAVRQFLAEGVDVDTVFQGFPVLCVAAQNGHDAIVEQLIGAGASVDTPNKQNGATALYVAAEKGHGTVVEKLIGAGASVDTPNKQEAPRRCPWRRRTDTAPWLKS